MRTSSNALTALEPATGTPPPWDGGSTLFQTPRATQSVPSRGSMGCKTKEIRVLLHGSNFTRQGRQWAHAISGANFVIIPLRYIRYSGQRRRRGFHFRRNFGGSDFKWVQGRQWAPAISGGNFVIIPLLQLIRPLVPAIISKCHFSTK